MHNGIVEILNRYLQGNLVAVRPGVEIKDDAHTRTYSDIETSILAVLDKDIRPAVAMDGGDVTFEKFEDGVVYLSMQGSCNGCPSSTATLKMGIETRLKSVIPEVVEVVSV